MRWRWSIAHYFPKAEARIGALPLVLAVGSDADALKGPRS
jgi:hypothetical protein